MDGETIIDWTPANWITVLIMVGLGYAIIGMIARIIKSRQTREA